MTRLRNFVFTLNNYSEVDIRQLLDYKCQYMLFAKEVAPTTGTPHLQGYCELSKQTSFGTLIQYMPRGIHIEPRRGTQDQAIAYIKTPRDKPIPNQSDLYEVGERRTQGTSMSQSALETARELLRVRSPIDPEIHGIGVIRAYERLQRYWPTSRDNSDDEFSRIWYYGPGGSGKTRAAYIYAGSYRTYKCDLIESGWFDGYDNHEAVILDDFNPDPDNDAQFKLLLSLLDKYPLKVNVKGASVNWNPKKIVITSQRPPWDYYGDPMTFTEDPDVWDKHEKLRQLMRRLDLVIKLDSNTNVRYPPVVESVDSKLVRLVLPNKFKVSRVGEKLIKELEEKWDTEEEAVGTNEEVDSYQDPECDAQKPQVEIEEVCPQGHQTSTRVPLADLD